MGNFLTNSGKLGTGLFVFCAIVACASQGDGAPLSPLKHSETLSDSVKQNDGPAEINLIAKDKKTLQINGVKFQFKGEQLEAGGAVYNTFLSEYGTVTGAFVVVTDKDVKQIRWPQGFKVEQIQNYTYRLVVEDFAKDLYGAYIKLKNDPQFSTVELAVDYSPRKKSY